MKNKTSKTIKPLKCFAIVNKRNQKLDAMSIYSDKDLIIEKDEVVVKVEIRVAE